MIRSSISNWALMCSFAAAFAFVGCASDTTSGETTGSLNLTLELDDGTIINEVDWEITGGDMEPMSGTIDTSAPGATASVEVFGLPPTLGQDYTITMEAVSEDGETTCTGSEDFGVDVGVATEIMVFLNCKRPETLGGVRVNGEFNICAELAKAVVSPLQTSVGNDIDLSAIGQDVEDDDIEYLWTGTGGSVDDPNAAETTYTCEELGENLITITVSDDDFEYCMHSWAVPVTCVEGDGLECTTPADCDDENDCTADICADGMCANPNLDPDESCDQNDGSVCDGEGSCVECNIDAQCNIGEMCTANECVPEVECTTPADCDDENDCTVDTCTAGECSNPNEEPGATCDQDGGAVCDGDGNCVACNDDDDCSVDEICVVDSCFGDPDLFCNEKLCEIDDAARLACIDRFVMCIAAEPANEEECILVALLECNECNENSDCEEGEVCNDNNVCEPAGEIPLPMVVDDNYFDRSGFSQSGQPLHSEDNNCPERAGEEQGVCHRFFWDGTGGPFTGTFWTDGEGFDNLNGLPVEAGATEVQFYAWGAAGGEQIVFGAGIGDEQYDGAEARRTITLTTAPTLYTVSLAVLAGYTDVYGPFIWAADTAGNPSGVEFYVDDIQWIQGGGGGPGCSDVIDFEDACGPYTFNDFEGGVATVIDNPDQSGINTTAKVAQMQKFEGAVFGGSTLVLDSVVDWTKGTAFTMKVWASREVPVLFKLEGLTQERSDTQTGSSSWEELCYDFAGSTDGAPATAITFIFDLGEVGDAAGDPDNWTFFFDGIVQTDGCGGGGGGELTVNGDFETGALNIADDPANGWTLAICDAADSCEATMDEANGGVWSGNLVVQGGIGDAVIKNANIGIGEVTPNSPVTVSVDIKGTTADGGVVFVQFFSELSGGGVSKEEFVANAVQATDTWTTYTLNTTTGPDVSGGVTLQLKSTCGAATTCVADVFFDNASVIIP